MRQISKSLDAFAFCRYIPSLNIHKGETRDFGKIGIGFQRGRVGIRLRENGKSVMMPPVGLMRLCLCGLALLLVGAGCVERRMVIITEPFGAIVYDEKNQPIGGAPADHPFTYYGKYRFRIAKDGYETLVVEQRVRAPWYELPGLDFISENLIPWTIRDVRYFRYVLQPRQVMPPESILGPADALRNYAKGIGTPGAPDLGQPIIPVVATPPASEVVPPTLLPPTP